MKSSIFGFSQSKLVEFNLDTIDALLLRYFIDFKDSGSMRKENIDGKEYYWLKYDGLMTELPILKVKKDTIYRRLRNMVELNILNHKTIRNRGTFSYYTLGDNYLQLVGYKNTKHTELNPIHYGNKSVGGTDSNPNPYGFKIIAPTDSNPEQTINLLKDNKSIKDKSIKYNYIYDRIINYLNKKANKVYKSTVKETQELIESRLNEGFNMQDFYKVIDIKVLEWKNTKMDKYLRPSTLFGSKFEWYLNQKSQEEMSENYRKETGIGFSV